MRAELLSLDRCAIDVQENVLVAFHDGMLIDHKQFCADVLDKAAALQKQQAQQYALYSESAYPFCVLLFALLHAGKNIWIPGNNKPGTAAKLTQKGCRLLGEWHGSETLPEDDGNTGYKLTALDLNSAQLSIFTSGSSGQAKAIIKSLLQLQCEVESLERQWGNLLGSARVLATVSHQHIYGLLFRVLWPLASGRCFHSQMYLSPEPMLNAAARQSSCWVASPAQLKRLDDLTPWSEIARLAAVFSSGGALSYDAAIQIKQHSGKNVIEVYGSSETGGIAWRIQLDNQFWTPFQAVKLQAVEDGRVQLFSPFLPNQTAFMLEDKIEFQQDGCFALLGRMDRIVKVEEKRLSLDELEKALNDSIWIEQSHTLVVTNKRDSIGAIIVLSADGRKKLKHHGRAVLTKQIRTELMEHFETVVLPRKWLFMQVIPVSAQGKIDSEMLTQLFTLDTAKYPQIQHCDLHYCKVEMELKVQPDLVYFSGHFPGQPILPGVAQLAWVEQFGKLFFGNERPFLRMEVIKFKKIIRPGDKITMQLIWKPETAKLYFDLHSVNDSHSSGRIVYGEID